MSDAHFLSYGWRIPFLISLVLVLVGFLVRTRLQDAPEFQAVKQEKAVSRVPVADLVRRQPRALVLASLASMAPPAVGYTVIVYMLTYGTTVVGFPRTTLLTLILLSTVVWGGAILGAAVAADRFGSKRVYMIGALTAVIWPLPMFALVDTKSTGLALLAFMVAAVVQGIMAGAQGGLFTGIFDVRVRYSGMSIAYQVGGMIGGAVTPMMATALFGAYHSATPIGLYVAGLALISLIAAAGLPSIAPSRTDDADATPSDTRPVGGVPATEPAS
jgi:Na+/melibiose symporter-like transporter